MRNPMIDAVTGPMQAGVDYALGLGARAAKILFSHSESISVSFESGRLKNTDAHENMMYGIEVLVDSRRGSTAGNDLAAINEMVERAAALARAGSAAHFSAYPPPAATAPVQNHSERTLALTREKMVADAQRIVDRLKEYDPELDIHAGAHRSEGESLLVTSGGVCHRRCGTRWALGSHCQRTEGTDMLFAGFGRGYGDLNEFYDPDYIAERILWDLRCGEKIVEPPTGPVTVYLPPETLPMFLFPLSLGVNGRNVAKGDSPLRGRMGRQVLDECMTIVDDPRRPFVGGREIDDDGIPTRKITIFENGVLRAFLYDLDSAGLAGAEPTGNNRCSPYALVLAPGNTPSDQLLAEVADGIYIKQLLGFGQSNIINGDFSGNVGLGFRIKDGKIIGRVKNTMVAGNIYDVFSRNVRLSSDVDPVSLMPHAVVEGITASAGQPHPMGHNIRAGSCT